MTGNLTKEYTKQVGDANRNFEQQDARNRKRNLVKRANEAVMWKTKNKKTINLLECLQVKFNVEKSSLMQTVVPISCRTSLM